MISRVLITVFLTGFLGGVLVTGVQKLGTIPIIVQAENYELKEFDSDADIRSKGTTYEQNLNGKTLFIHNNPDLPHQHSNVDDLHDSDSWIPEQLVERTFFTGISNIVTGIAFSFLLVGVYILRGKSVSIKSGLFWGSMGFIVFSLAPSLGLPPELPGMNKSELGSRQLWWIGTVILTAVGVGILIESKSLLFKIFALILITLPHIIGESRPNVVESIIPTELSSQFVIVSLLTSAFFWIVLGVFSGYFYKKQVQELNLK